MLITTPYNQAGLNITVTSTATAMYDLINTAQGTGDLPYAGYSSAETGFNITIEGGDIRMAYGKDATALLGTPLYSGMVYRIRGLSPKYYTFISVDGTDSKCAIEVGRSEPGEVSNSSPAGRPRMQEIIHDSVDMPSAATEYSYELPNGARRLGLRLDSDEDLQLNLGGVAAQSGIEYMPVKDGEWYWIEEDIIDFMDGYTIYFQSPSASQTLRTIIYK